MVPDFNALSTFIKQNVGQNFPSQQQKNDIIVKLDEMVKHNKFRKKML